MKPHRNSLGRNPLSDAISKLGYGVKWKGLSCYPLGGALYLDLCTMLNEQGLSHHILSDMLHLLPSVDFLSMFFPSVYFLSMFFGSCGFYLYPTPTCLGLIDLVVVVVAASKFHVMESAFA
jgi:hypothetical protein